MSERVDRKYHPTNIAEIDMTVEPYGEVKDFLDARARETMYAIKKRINEILSFEGDDDSKL